MADPKLSVVIIAYEMPRALPRTIQSLSPPYQQDVSADDYELIVIDNGSPEPVAEAELASWGARVRAVHLEDAPPTPVEAVNLGLSMAQAPIVGVMIDGARMATPGLLASVLQAARLHERAVIGTLAFHLGPDVQKRTIPAGYDATVEDRLLDGIDWPSNGYRLFEIAALGGSSSGGVLNPISETSALFMPRDLWHELGGFDERFRSPGGGLVNLDTWRRACDLPDTRVVMPIAEATFHQIHGGVATNSTSSPFRDFHDEYRQITGQDFVRPHVAPIVVGDVQREALPWLVRSAQSRLAADSG